MNGRTESKGTGKGINTTLNIVLLLNCLAGANVMAQQVEADTGYLPSAGCIIEPSMKINISSPVEGVLAKKPFKLGQQVKKGDLLFSLRSDVEIASVELAKIRAEFAKRHYERNEELYQDDVISIHERDEFLTEYKVAVQELQQTRAVLGMRSVHSPISGVVIDYFVESGEFVTNQPVLALAALDPLKVEIVMPYESLGSVAPESALTVHPVEPVGGQYSAKVFMIDPVIDAASGTYRIRAHIDNPGYKLPAGIECKASL